MKKSNWKLGLVAFLIVICCVPKSVNAYSLEKDDYDWTENSTNWIVKKCEYVHSAAPESMKKTIYIRKGYNYKNNVRENNGMPVYLNPHDGTTSWVANPFRVRPFNDPEVQTKYATGEECPKGLDIKSGAPYFYDNSGDETTGKIYELVDSPKYIPNKNQFCTGTVTNEYSSDHKTVDLTLNINPNGEFVLNDNGQKYYEFMEENKLLGNHSWEFKHNSTRKNTLIWENLEHYLNFNELGCSQQYMFLLHKTAISLTGGVYVFVLSDSPISQYCWEAAIGWESLIGQTVCFDDKHDIWTNYNTDKKLKSNECRKLSGDVKKKYGELEKKYRRKILDEVAYPIADTKAEKITVEFMKEKYTLYEKIKKQYEEEKGKIFTNECSENNYTDILVDYVEEWNKTINAVKEALKIKIEQVNKSTNLTEKERAELNEIFDKLVQLSDGLYANLGFQMLGEADVINCNDPEEQALFQEFQKIFDWIKILVPIILIVMGVFDFGKAVLASDEKAIKQAQGKFIKRIIIALIIFLLPTIIEILFNILRDNTNIKVNDPLCGVK